MSSFGEDWTRRWQNGHPADDANVVLEDGLKHGRRLYYLEAE